MHSEPMPTRKFIECDVHTDEMLIKVTRGCSIPARTAFCGWRCALTARWLPKCTPHIGYLHRCAEKIAENVTPRQFLPYTDRLDYLAAMSMNLGWALTVEKLLGLKVSEKTRHLRIIMVELNRIASHLVAAGCYGLDLGSFTPFTWTFRDREKILNLFEDVCGASLTCSYITVGGVTADVPSGWLQKCEMFLDRIRAGHRRTARRAHQQTQSSFAAQPGIGSAASGNGDP